MNRFVLPLALTLATGVAGAALGLSWFATPNSADAMGGKARMYEVTVTNLTRGQVFSPPVVVSHSDRQAPLWTVGQPAGTELAGVAEDAANGPLVTLLQGQDEVQDVQTGTAPIPPGQSATVTVEIRGRRNLISVVGMLVQTNDAFYGLSGARAPRNRDRFRVRAYDAGSEANNEDGDFIPGPPFMNGNVRATDGAEGFVHIHAGVQGIADLAPETYDWRNPTAQITIRRVR